MTATLRAAFAPTRAARYLDRYARRGRHRATSAHTIARDVPEGGALRSSWRRPALAAGWRAPEGKTA